MNQSANSLEELLLSLKDIFYPADDDKFVSLTSRTPEGDTPLHVVVRRNDLTGISLIIGAGADLNAVDNFNETPLHVAIRLGFPEATEMILKAGARVDIRSDFNQTAKELLEAGKL